MQLNEIFEEHSLKSISKKTNISEENIEMILADDYSSISKVKALGFISIIERDYAADLSKKKEQALSYYSTHAEDKSISLRMPMVKEKKKRSKWGVILVLGLLAYISWYFFAQFDSKNFSDIHSSFEKKAENSIDPKENYVPKVEKSLSIENAFSNTQTDASGAQSDIIETSIEARVVVPDIEESNDTNFNDDANLSSDEPEEPKSIISANIQSIMLVPKSRLWFGIIEMSTGKRNHSSVSDKYEIDVEKKSWLIATSPASFKFIIQDETQEYNDGKEHYFKVSKDGVESLTKSAYVLQGGHKKW